MTSSSSSKVSLRKFQLLCKPADVEEFERAYATEKNEENLVRLVDAYVNAERTEDVEKGMQFIRDVMGEAAQKKELLFQLACCLLRRGDYENARKTVDECLELDGEFWKAKALREMITTSLSSSQGSRISRLEAGALTAIAVAAGGVAWIWSSRRIKMLRTMTLPEWKEASELVDKIEKRVGQDTLIGAGIGAVSVGILVVGYFFILAKHIMD